MEVNNPSGERTKRTKLMTGLEIIESEVIIEKPIYKKVTVEVPNFVQKEIEVPCGFEAFVDKAGEMIVNKVMEKIGPQLEKMVKERIPSSIEIPRVTYKDEIKVITKEIEQEVVKPVIKEVEVTNANIKNVEVTNAIIKDVPVTNAVIKDMEVINAVPVDKEVTNAVITDQEVTNAVVKHKTIEVIHPKYITPSGKLIEEESDGKHG